jgi:ligand-binding SRPBCC domain-containing protein
MKKYYLRRSQVIPGSLEDIFPFFSNPRNLARLTPPWVGFKIIECPDGDVEKGTRIRYRIKLFFVPMYWETLINDCTVGVSFVDSQVRGPYQSWVHSHFFSESSGDTVMRDEVAYEMPFSFIGRIAHFLFIKRTLNNIFDYRHRAIEEIFASPGIVPDVSRDAML